MIFFIALSNPSVFKLLDDCSKEPFGLKQEQRVLVSLIIYFVKDALSETKGMSQHFLIEGTVYRKPIKIEGEFSILKMGYLLL